MTTLLQEYTDPKLKDVLDTFELNIFYKFNCHRVGIIESFNTSKLTANVQLVDKRVIPVANNDNLMTQSLPILMDRPVIVNANSIGGITRPINSGDTCLILFNDRDMDNWINDGNVQAPASPRSHDYSDAIILPGIFNNVNVLTNYSNNATSLYYNQSKIVLNSLGINQQTETGGQITQTNQIANITLMPEGLIEIKNTAQSLSTILNSLITALTNLQILVPALDPSNPSGTVYSSSITELQQVQTNLDLLLVP